MRAPILASARIKRFKAVRVALTISIFISVFLSGFPTQPAFALKQITLTIGTDPKSFNPAVAQETSTSSVIGFLFEGLTRFNPETGDVEPWLAESWERREDGLEWMFHLRKDVFWSDGTPFTSKDVEFTFRDLMFNDRTPVPSRTIFTLKGIPLMVKALDDHTVRFNLPSPFAPFLLSLGQPILPEHALGKAVAEGRLATVWGIREEPTDIIGTGPFKLKRYQPGERVELVRNELYWKKGPQGQQTPLLEKINLLVVPNPEARLLNFLDGGTDIYALRGLDYPLLAPKEKKGDFTIYECGADVGSHFLSFNFNDKDPVHRAWFRSRKFREAVACAIDRGSMIDVVYNRMAVMQCSPVSPAIPFFFNANVPCPAHDPERAKTLLSEIGFKDMNGDGILEDEENRPLEFVLATNSENPERLELTSIIREDLSRIGMKVHLLPLEFNSLVVKLVATGDWDSAVIGFTGVIDPHFAATVWKTDGSLHFWNRSGRPVAGWEKKIDEIFDQAGATLDRDERKALYDEWQLIAAQELPFINTVLPKIVYAVRNRFTNIRPTSLGAVLHNIDEIDTKET